MYSRMMIGCLTLFCRSSAAPALVSSEKTSAQPALAAIISNEFPSCVMSGKCVQGRKKDLKKLHKTEYNIMFECFRIANCAGIDT